MKLKNVLSQNSHIETIFVEFTDNNIPKGIDDWIHGEMEMNSNFIKYAYLTDTKDILAIANENPLGMFKSLPKIVRRNIGYIKTSQNLIDDFGGYYSLSHKLNSSPNHSSENKGEITLSDLNLRYLENIIKLARKSNVDIFLITTPVHEEKNVNSYFKNVLENQFGEVSYLDFSNFKLEVDEYADLQHLNKYGAKRFSLWFNEFLELEKLNQTTADSLIEVANRNQANLFD